MHRIIFLISIALGFVALTPARAAEAVASGEERLRAAFREANSRREIAEAELVNLRAAQAALAEEKKALSEKYEALKKQLVADRASMDKTATALSAQVADQKATIAQLTENLAKAKEEGGKAAQAARAAEAEGVKLTNLNAALERRAADLQTKNLALFLLGNQILSRYEEFSLGKALKAKEPFVGLSRTKLENLVQEYQDKLLDERVRQ